MLGLGLLGCPRSPDLVEPELQAGPSTSRDQLERGHETLESVLCSDEPVVAGDIPEGCPVPLIRVNRESIEVAWDIGFDSAGKLDAPSTPVIDLLASVLIRDATIRRVQVGLIRMERSGADDSSERASAVVERLLERGVDKRRVTAKGFGIAPEKDASGKPLRSARPSGYRLSVAVLSRSGRKIDKSLYQGETSITTVPGAPAQPSDPSSEEKK